MVLLNCIVPFKDIWQLLGNSYCFKHLYKEGVRGRTAVWDFLAVQFLKAGQLYIVQSFNSIQFNKPLLVNAPTVSWPHCDRHILLCCFRRFQSYWPNGKKMPFLTLTLSCHLSAAAWRGVALSPVVRWFSSGTASAYLAAASVAGEGRKKQKQKQSQWSLITIHLKKSKWTHNK